MKVIKTIDEMKRVRKELAEPAGFVPTMGYLHKGHLSLVKRARNENESVIASIFVNPTQFGQGEDLESYPRDLQRDLSLLEKEKTDIVFIPEQETMYPIGYNTWVQVDEITQRLEGASRPTHFRGVTTIVAKLFNIVEPAKAYFGQKDAQQAIVIRKMVDDLNMNLEVVVAPTVRESDGLAMSSRNKYLGAEERKAATILSRSLNLAEQLYSQGERDTSLIRNKMIELIKSEPLAQMDYISIANPDTLEELDKIETGALVSLAVKIGKPRLIDNIILQ